MKKSLLLIIFLLFSCSKNDDFPVTEWNSNSEKPMIFYISGDAGFNTFSKNFSENLHQLGYDVFSLNSKKYFWNKKTPQKTTADTLNFINAQLKNRKNKNVILIGFSYGCDVMPFIINRFPKDFKQHIQKVFLIGPSETADFEIHLENFVNSEIKGSLKVIPEINRMGNIPTVMIVSDFELLHFPYKKVKLPNYEFKYIAGNHHYSNKTDVLAKTVDSFVK